MNRTAVMANGAPNRPDTQPATCPTTGGPLPAPSNAQRWYASPEIEMLDRPATTSSHPRGWRGSRDTMRAPIRAQLMVARVTIGQPCTVHTFADRSGARIAVNTLSRTAQIVASTASDHATRV